MCKVLLSGFGEHQKIHTKPLPQLSRFGPCCRWGNTPLDEGRMSGNKNLIKLLEIAKSSQVAEISKQFSEITGAKLYLIVRPADNGDSLP